ncbi:hypothetical protein [Tunturiibacter gelidiferens]|uniref:hypothetical protein n=1 Tax=Tunturiibacter gelidiferens TaxID=3069689 RepID=UPI003D9BE9F6
MDALIQRRVLLSADILGYVSRSHPVQTIILLSMLPSAEQTGNLMQWYYGPRPDDGSNHLHRVSAMLLSKSPPPGFAANSLASSEERLIVYIVRTKDIGVGLGSTSGGISGSYAISRPSGGWPDIPSYHLTENDNAGIDPVLVESGGDRISWQRSTPWSRLSVMWRRKRPHARDPPPRSRRNAETARRGHVVTDAEGCKHR